MLTNGKVEKLVSKIENNGIILKVNFTTYQGKVEVIDDVSSIKYYFIEENTTIEKKLIKNISKEDLETFLKVLNIMKENIKIEEGKDKIC